MIDDGLPSETDEQFVERARDAFGSLTWREKARLFALARRGAESQWRPIEEAPKDGAWMLFAWFDGGYPGRCKPTHWMPLPPPPEKDTQP